MSIRTQQGPRPMRVRLVRWMSVLALASYPIGVGALAFGDPEGFTLAEVAGYGVLLVTLAAFTVIASSGVQRIAGESAKGLDEVEMALRHRAYARAYQIITGVVAVGLLYLWLATDVAHKVTVWIPSTGDHWQAVMFGVLLLMTVLPAAFLAWSMPVEEIEADD